MTQKTALYEKHVELGGKMVEFAGFWMPVQYRSITEEHLAVRNAAGLFDVSHMGEFIFQGKDALDFINYITINNVADLDFGQAQYSAMCNPDGGLVDDLIVYRFQDRYMMVVNAANIDKDYKHIESNLRGDVELENVSDKISLLALQGPESEKILQPLTGTKLAEIEFYHFTESGVSGIEAVISRTGYTGEPGFELYISNADAPRLWDLIMESGDSHNLKPAGLGARDSLRLEMKYALYGNDISAGTNPLEAGLGWITKLDKGDFIGGEALRKIEQEGVKRRLVCFELEGKAFPRLHYPIYIDGAKVSEVTSGTFSPTLEKGIGLAYLPVGKHKPGTEIAIEIRQKMVRGIVVKPPFYKK